MKATNAYLSVLAIYIAIAAVIALWTERSLEIWFSYFKGEAVDIPYWAALLLTLVLNGDIVVANILSEILRFAI